MRGNNTDIKRKPGRPRIKPEVKPKAGRPSTYDPRYVGVAEGMCKLGATEEELANAFGIEVSTLWRWKRDHEDLRNAINDAHDEFDNARIKKSLRDRALGYTWTENVTEVTEIECEKVNKEGVTIRDDKGRKIMVRVPATKTRTRNVHVPAEPVCIFFWLTNRDRAKWQHVRVNKVEGKLDMPAMIEQNNFYDLGDLKEDELESLRNTLAKAIEQKQKRESKDMQSGNA